MDLSLENLRKRCSAGPTSSVPASISPSAFSESCPFCSMMLSKEFNGALLGIGFQIFISSPKQECIHPFLPHRDDVGNVIFIQRSLGRQGFSCPFSAKAPGISPGLFFENLRKQGSATGELLLYQCPENVRQAVSQRRLYSPGDRTRYMRTGPSLGEKVGGRTLRHISQRITVAPRALPFYLSVSGNQTVDKPLLAGAAHLFIVWTS